MIVPYQYAKSEMSIVDVTKLGLDAILKGKVVQPNQNKKYQKLLKEIDFDVFLYDKNKSSEMFI